MISWLTPRRPEDRSRLNPQMSAECVEVAVNKLGVLMDRYPLAIVDTKLLPMRKADMKMALKIAWQVTPDGQVRNQIEEGYIHLSHFQDGVGDTPIDPTLPRDCSLSQARAILRPYNAWAKEVQAEAKTLLAELKEFKQSMKAS